MTMTKSTDLARGKLEITAYLNKTTGQPEFFAPESQLVLNLPAAVKFVEGNLDKKFYIDGREYDWSDVKADDYLEIALRHYAFRDEKALLINTKHTENGRLVCSVDGKRIAIRDAAADAIEAHHTQGLITVLRNEHNKTCVLSENFMMLGAYHVEVAIRQFGKGAPVKGSCVLNDEVCRVWSPEEVLVEKNLNAESNSEHEIELEKKFAAEEAREEKRLKAREITAKLNIKLQTLPLENLTLTAPDGTLRTVPKKEIYFVTFFTPEPEIELIDDAGITFAKFSSAAEAEAALKLNENNSETETNSEVPLAYLEAFQKIPTVEALHSGYEAHCRKIDELMRRSDIAMKFRDYKFHIIQNEKDMAFYSKLQCEDAKNRCAELDADTFRTNFEINQLKAQNPDLVECGFFDECEAKIEKSRKEHAAETEKTLKEIPKSEILNELEPEFFDKYPRCAEIADTINEIVDDISDVDLLILKAEAKGDIAQAERLKNYNVERGVEIENLECELGLQGTTSPQEAKTLMTRLKATKAEKYVATLRTCDHENELFKECDSLEEAGKFIYLNVSAHHQPEIRFDGRKIEHGGAIVYCDFDGEKATCPELEAAFAKWTAAFEDDNPPPEVIPFPENKVADSDECEGYDEEAFDLLPSLEELNDPETEVEKILNELEELHSETAGMRPSEDYAKWRELQRREEGLLGRLIWLQPLSEGEAEVVKPENKLMKLVKLRLKVDEARWKVVRAKMELEAAMEECLALEREEYAELEREAV